MKRLRPLRRALAVMVLAGGFSALGLAAPRCVYACSCIPPQPIAEYGDDEGTVIVAGTVIGMGQDQQGLFRAERWYRGSSELADLPIRGGNGADCGLPMVAGQQLLLVAFVDGGVLHPNICSPSGDLSTPGGQQLEADAIAAFGPATPQGGESPEGGASAGLPWIVVVGGATIIGVIVIVGLASFASGRRGS